MGPAGAAVHRPGRPIAIVGGLLLDATGAAPRCDQTVVIEGERITAVGPTERSRCPPAPSVIDAAGMTVMPGLINSNQHIQLNPAVPVAGGEPAARAHSGRVGSQLGAAATPRVRVPDAGRHQHAEHERARRSGSCRSSRRSTVARSQVRACSLAARCCRASRASGATLRQQQHAAGRGAVRARRVRLRRHRATSTGTRSGSRGRSSTTGSC